MDIQSPFESVRNLPWQASGVPVDQQQPGEPNQPTQPTEPGEPTRPDQPPPAPVA